MSSLAVQFREAAEGTYNAPEGIELFDWYWVPISYQFWVIALPLPSCHAIKQEISAWTPMDDLRVVIKPHITFSHGDQLGSRARIGWDRIERKAVLFYEQGGNFPPRQFDGTELAHRLARQGAWILQCERLEKLRRLVDGEEWKDG